MDKFNELRKTYGEYIYHGYEINEIGFSFHFTQIIGYIRNGMISIQWITFVKLRGTIHHSILLQLENNEIYV